MLVRQSDDRRVRLDDFRLILGNRRNRWSENGRVVEGNFGKHRQLGTSQRIGRIIQATEAGFNHRPLHVLIAEPDHTDQEEPFKHGDIAGRQAHIFQNRQNFMISIDEVCWTDPRPIELQLFTRVINGGTAKTPDAVSLCLQNTAEHCPSRALAIGPRDMDNVIVMVWVTEMRHDSP